MSIVRKVRKELGLSRADLALRLKMSAQNIERYEAEPPITLLEKLAEVAREHGRPDLASEVLGNEPNTSAHGLSHGEKRLVACRSVRT